MVADLAGRIGQLGLQFIFGDLAVAVRVDGEGIIEIGNRRVYPTFQMVLENLEKQVALAHLVGISACHTDHQDHAGEES